MLPARPRGFRPLSFALGGSLLLALSLPAAAQAGSAPQEEAARYAACLALAEKAPGEALDSALAWEKAGGGDAARHCQALAMLGLGEAEDAAFALERLAADQPAAAGARAAALLAQAAQAWIAAGRSERALEDQSRALALHPGDAELWLDRALALGDDGRYEAALEDLAQASRLAGERADLLTYRAAALIHLRRPDEAGRALDRALALAPDHAPAWLERGRLLKAAGDRRGARAALL